MLTTSARPPARGWGYETTTGSSVANSGSCRRAIPKLTRDTSLTPMFGLPWWRWSPLTNLSSTAKSDARTGVGQAVHDGSSVRFVAQAQLAGNPLNHPL